MNTVCRYLVYLTFPLATLAVVTNVRAQSITSDGTLSTQVQSNDNLNFDITQGNRQGNNLFHSFKDFGVPNNGSARFLNQTDIANIFSRVTGGNISEINGLLEAQGTANLFLINPSGIVFGPDASLNVGGSFFGSTASGILFNDGVEFSATDTQPSPLLSVNIPIGLRFRDNPGSITIGNDLVNNPTSASPSFQVQPGKTLAFVGGEINLNGRRLRAPGGRIELGALAAEGIVGINNDLSLIFPEDVARADVSLNAAQVDVTSGDKGSVSINARNINIRSDSDICAGIGADSACGRLATNSGSVGSQAGDITLNALETINITGSGSSVRNLVNTGATGNSGEVNVITESLFVTNGAVIASTTLGTGDSGKINIIARDNVSFDNSSIASNIFPSAIGNSGGVDITTGSLSIANGTRIQSVVAGQGDGGNLFIKATELVEVLGTEEPGKSSIIAASIFTGGTGKAGDLTIETKKLVIRNSQALSLTDGKGNAGNLTVKASESVDIIGKVLPANQQDPTQPIRNPSGLFSQVNLSGEGNSGNLTVETPRLSVGNGGKIQVAVFGKGNAGNLFIRAADIDIYDTPGKADFFEGGIFAGFQVDDVQTEVPPSGDFGGTVTIETDRLRVRDGGAITVFTEGDGNAGILKIDAKEFIEVYGKVNAATTNRVFTSKISAEATEESTGNSGTVKLNTNTLIVRDGGKITAENLGQGKEAGSIDIQVGELLLLRRGGTISTNSAQDTDGGNININTGVLVAFPEEDSDITSNAVRGMGGRIDIKALGIFGIVPRPFPTKFSDITANSEFGVSGTITINNPEVDPNSGLIELPQTVVDAKNQIAQNACRQGFGSELVATGRGGLPPSPTQDLRSSAVRVGLATPVISNTTNTIAIKPQPTPTVKKIVPAQGWVFNSKGQVVLTAYNPTNQIGVRRTAHNALCKEK